MIRGFLLALLVAAGCMRASDAPRHTPDPAQLRAELMQADRDFAAATAARGIEGWMTGFAVDAIRFDNDDRAVQGLDAIRHLDEPFMSDSTRLLTWEPTDAGSFEGGTLGFTRGRYAVVTRPAWDTLGTGRYLTFWRRGPDGWRAIFDTGNPDPAERD